MNRYSITFPGPPDRGKKKRKSNMVSKFRSWSPAAILYSTKREIACAGSLYIRLGKGRNVALTLRERKTGRKRKQQKRAKFKWPRFKSISYCFRAPTSKLYWIGIKFKKTRKRRRKKDGESVKKNKV